MTRVELAEDVARLGIRSDAYDLTGMRDECYVLVRHDGGYQLAYSERGRRTGAQAFPDEGTALAALLDTLVHDRTTRV